MDELNKLIDKQSKYIKWLEEVQRRYEARLQDQANIIHVYRIHAIAREENREATFAELIAYRHIETERYVEEA
jgi:hypothetical protein